MRFDNKFNAVVLTKPTSTNVIVCKGKRYQISFLKAYGKLVESIPPGFRNSTQHKTQSILSYLNITKQPIAGLKANIILFKKKVYSRQEPQTPEI